MSDKELDLELLEKLARGEDPLLPHSDQEKTKKRSKENPLVIKFIQRYQIKQGDIKYPNYLIFYHFRKWCEEKYHYSKNGLTEFFRTFNKHFTQTRTGRQRYYLLNDALDMSEETLTKAKRHNKYYRSIRRSINDKKNQKEQG